MKRGAKRVSESCCRVEIDLNSRLQMKSVGVEITRRGGPPYAMKGCVGTACEMMGEIEISIAGVGGEGCERATMKIRCWGDLTT